MAPSATVRGSHSWEMHLRLGLALILLKMDNWEMGIISCLGFRVKEVEFSSGLPDLLVFSGTPAVLDQPTTRYQHNSAAPLLISIIIFDSHTIHIIITWKTPPWNQPAASIHCPKTSILDDLSAFWKDHWTAAKFGCCFAGPEPTNCYKSVLGGSHWSRSKMISCQSAVCRNFWELFCCSRQRGLCLLPESQLNGSTFSCRKRCWWL